MEQIFRMFKKVLIHWLIVILFIFFGLSINGLYLLSCDDSLIVVDTYSFGNYLDYLIHNVEPKINFLAAITAILSTFISIAIPLSINQVSNCLKEYQDKEIQEMFYNEPAFIRMLYVIIFLFISLLSWYFVDNFSYVGLLLLSFSLLSLFYFYQFFYRVIEYVTATGDIVHDHFHNKILNLLGFDNRQ